MAYVVACDYDKTLFEKSWPEMGDPKEDVINQLKAFKKAGAEIVLWTCREGKSLQEAISRCTNEKLEFDSINETAPSQKKYQQTKLVDNGEVFGLRKIYADIYVDDRSPGSIDYFLSLDPREECKKTENKKK